MSRFEESIFLLTESIVGSAPSLLEQRARLQGDALRLEIFRHGEGDFGGDAKHEAMISVTVQGDAYAIKDDLKKLRFRWNPGAKLWEANFTTRFGKPLKRSTHRSKRAIEAAIESAKDIIRVSNERALASNVREMKKRGYRMNDQLKKSKSRARSITKMFSEMDRQRSLLADYGIETGYDFDRSVFFVSGNTYPIREFLKDNGFRFDSGQRRWSAPRGVMDKISTSFGRDLAKTLKALGRRPEGKAGSRQSKSQVGKALADRLQAYKDHKDRLENDAEYAALWYEATYG
jgi:hypothetical protein